MGRAGGGSEAAQDATPDRLTRARQFVEETVESLGGDRVGLIEFAGTAAMRVPLTLNYGAFRATLGELRPLSGARGGTALANAIELAAESFPESSAGSRAIVSRQWKDFNKVSSSHPCRAMMMWVV